MDTNSPTLQSALLFGNGLNRLNPENPSWEELMEQICQSGASPLGGMIPTTLKLENLLLSEKADTAVPHRVEYRPTDYKIRWKIATASLSLKESEYYERLAKMNVTHYLTTNYEACLDFTFRKYGLKSVAYNTQELIYSISRYTRFSEPEKTLWNIHGFARYPSSLMIGYSQYCGSIAKMKDFMTLEKPVLERLRKGETTPLCWGDFFFTHNLHLVGLSLDYSDIDLWWVLSERKRAMLQHPELIQNEVHFYYVAFGAPDRNFIGLLEGLGVTVHTYVVNKHQRKAVRWRKAYDQIFLDLENLLGVQELVLQTEQLF